MTAIMPFDPLYFFFNLYLIHNILCLFFNLLNMVRVLNQILFQAHDRKIIIILTKVVLSGLSFDFLKQLAVLTFLLTPFD